MKNIPQKFYQGHNQPLVSTVGALIKELEQLPKHMEMRYPVTISVCIDHPQGPKAYVASIADFW